MAFHPAILLISACNDLVAAELHGQMLDPEIICFSTQDEFRLAVETREFELVLCDYAMSGIGPLTILDLLKERNLEVPLIVLAGESDERRAIEAIRHGAADYVIKGQWARLGAVVERELDKSVRQKSNDALFHIVGKVAKIGGWNVDFSENRIVWSDQVCEILEMPRGTSPSFEDAWDYFAPEWQEPIGEAFERCLADGVAFDEQMEIITAKGKKVWVRVIGEGIRNHDGTISNIQGAMQDVSEMKAAEAERVDKDRCLTTTMEHIMDPFYTVDRDWRITFMNEPALLNLNRERDELIGQVLWDAFGNLKESNIGQKYLRAVSENRSIHMVEYYPSLDRWYEIVAYPSNGGLAISYHDVTERRQKDEQLILLNQCVSLINDVVLITEADLLDEPGPRIVFVNEAFLQCTGYSREEVIGRSPRLLQGEGTQPDRLKKIREALELGLPVQTELLNYKKNGEAFWVDLDIVPVSGASGEVTHFVAVQRDITSRKLAEESARANELRFAAQRSALVSLTRETWTDEVEVGDILKRVTEISSRTLDVARVSVWELRKQEGIIECLNLYEADTDVHSSGMILSETDYPSYFRALYDREIITADDARQDPVTRQLASDYLEPLGVTSLMDVPFSSGGEINYVLCHEHCGPVRSWTPDEKTFAMAVSSSIALALETRERYLAQKEILSNHQRFQAMLSATNDTVWDWDLERMRFWWQDGFSRLFGWPQAENEGSIHAWIRQIHFEDRKRVMAGLCSTIRSGESQWSDEYRFVNNEGVIAHVLDRGRVFRDAQGKAVRMVGGMMDLTEKISAARELMAAHQALRMLSACNEMLLRATEEEELIAEVCRIAVEVGEYRMAWVGYAVDDELKSVVPMAHAGVVDGFFSLREFSWAEDSEAGNGPTGTAIRSGEMVVIEDMLVNPMFSPWAHLARERGYRCGICLPLRDGEHVFGVLVLYGKRPHLAGEEEVRMLKEMASALGFGIQSLRIRDERRHLEQTIVKVAKAASNVTGSEFFDALSQSLVDAVGADAGLIGRCNPDKGVIETVSVVQHGKLIGGFHYSFVGTAIETLVCGKPC
ncbi:MAG: PAS domain-containing protein, partial [Luteolibacter sp.]